MLTSYLINGSKKGSDNIYLANIASDIFLTIFFIFYCFNVQNQKKWIVFPHNLGLILGALLGISLFAARVPQLYLMRQAQNSVNDTWSFNNALFVLSASVVPITCYGAYWSLSFMIFYPEYTLCPGNYHAIHDPIIQVVCVSMSIEGALDVLSSASLMSLAASTLPFPLHGTVIFCCLLELLNGCQCFALQAMLSGVLEDTAAQLVKCKAAVRASRCVIDFIVFVVRVVLWAAYGAVSPVFLVKNIYNLVHGISMVERAAGVKCYEKGKTLFMGFVTQYDWYDMTAEEWAAATMPDSRRGVL